MPVVEKLRRALAIETVSYPDERLENKAAFDAFMDFMEAAFPLVHERLDRQLIHPHAPLYRYENKEATLSILCLAHFDVVPTGEPGKWTHPPFAAAMEEDVIWGRGALDCKHQLVALMQAMESLLERGEKPAFDISFAFGCDEEVGGERGAKQIAAFLKQQGRRFDLILDEGGCVAENMIQGVAQPLALVGMAEKGSTQVILRRESLGGHASMPPKQTALTALAEVVSQLAKHPMPVRLTPTVQAMFEALAPLHPQGFLLKHVRFLAPLLARVLGKAPSMDALFRSSILATLFEAGDAPNAIPQSASLCLNARLLQGDTVDDFLAHVEKHTGVPAGDWVFQQKNEASHTAASSGPGYALLMEQIREFYPKATVLPYLMAGATDARHYQELSEQIYRFTPLVLEAKDLDLIHAYDERITVSALRGMQAFYEGLFLKKTAVL